MCPNLEDVVVSRAPFESIRQMGFSNNQRTVGPLKKLKSLIVVAFPLDAPFHQRGPFAQQHKLTTFWSNVFNIPSSELKWNNCSDLAWYIPGNQQLSDAEAEQIREEIRERARLSTYLRSVSEPLPVLMQLPECAPQLKLVSCFYNGLVWFKLYI